MSFIQKLLCCFHDGLSFQSSINSPQESLNSQPSCQQSEDVHASVWKSPKCMCEMGQAASDASWRRPSQPHAEDFIFRAKAPADNMGKGGGGGKDIFGNRMPGSVSS